MADEISDFVEWMLASGKSYSEETITTYALRLRQILIKSGAKSLESFNQRDWQQLNTWLRQEEKGFRYNNALKTALFVYWSEYLRLDVKREKQFYMHERKPDMREVEKQHDHEKYKDELLVFLEVEFPKIYKVDLAAGRSNADPVVALRNKVMFIVNFFVAGRRGELHRMMIEDLHFEDRSIDIRASKTREVLNIPMPEDRFWKVVEEYIATLGRTSGPLFLSTMTGKALSKSRISSTISETGRIVWGKHVWSHYLRFMRSSLLGSILPLEQLQRFMRHKDPRTTSAYYRSKGRIDEELRKSMKQKTKDII